MSGFKSWEELTELEQAQVTYSDFFKDVHGFRPRTMTEGWTLADYDSAFKVLEIDAKQEFDRIEQMQKAAIKSFEESLEKIQEICACDRNTAWRYMKDGENGNWYDSSYFEYSLGLPYGYLKFNKFEDDSIFTYTPEEVA